MTAAEQATAPEWRDVSWIRTRLAGRQGFWVRLILSWLDDSPAVPCRTDDGCTNEREAADAWAEIPDAMKHGIRLADGVRRLREQRDANGRAGDELAAAARDLATGQLYGEDAVDAEQRALRAVQRWETGQ